jgi:hypothetical protein
MKARVIARIWSPNPPGAAASLDAPLFVMTAPVLPVIGPSSRPPQRHPDGPCLPLPPGRVKMAPRSQPWLQRLRTSGLRRPLASAPR